MSRPFRRQDFDAPAFYVALNKIRNLRDFTWKELSVASGVSTTTLSRMADGRHPDAASLASLSHWGGLNPANFMSDPSKPPYDKSLSAIVARLRASIAWLRDGTPTTSGGIGLGDMIDMLPILEAALTAQQAPQAAREGVGANVAWNAGVAWAHSRAGSVPSVGMRSPLREAFEAYITKDRGDLSTFGSGKNLHYRNSAVNNAWEGWQARDRLTAPPTAPEPVLASEDTKRLNWLQRSRLTLSANWQQVRPTSFEFIGFSVEGFSPVHATTRGAIDAARAPVPAAGEPKGEQSQ